MKITPTNKLNSIKSFSHLQLKDRKQTPKQKGLNLTKKTIEELQCAKYMKILDWMQCNCFVAKKLKLIKKQRKISKKANKIMPPKNTHKLTSICKLNLSALLKHCTSVTIEKSENKSTS